MYRRRAISFSGRFTGLPFVEDGGDGDGGDGDGDDDDDGAIGSDSGSGGSTTLAWRGRSGEDFNGLYFPGPDGEMVASILLDWGLLQTFHCLIIRPVTMF